MRLLIDAYNVLHAEPPPGWRPLHEASLVGALARSPWSGSATLVCDGMPKPHSPSVNTAAMAGVELVFSGVAQSADDVIIGRIERDPRPRELVVVSTDREIRSAAKAGRAVNWTSDAFLTRLAAALRGKPTPAPTSAEPRAKPDHPMDEHQVRAWLREMGIDPGPR